MWYISSRSVLCASVMSVCGVYKMYCVLIQCWNWKQKENKWNNVRSNLLIRHRLRLCQPHSPSTLSSSPLSHSHSIDLCNIDYEFTHLISWILNINNSRSGSRINTHPHPTYTQYNCCRNTIYKLIGLVCVCARIWIDLMHLSKSKITANCIWITIMYT